MDKIVDLYSFEIKPALADESSHSWIMLSINKVAIDLQWLRDWEYFDSALDIVLFAFDRM